MLVSLCLLWATVATGSVVLALWFPSDRPEGRRRTAAGVLHIVLAVTAVSTLMVLALGRSQGVGIAGVGALGAAVAVAVGIGTTVATRRWERRVSAGPGTAVPVAALVIHGALASVAGLVTVMAVGSWR